MSPLHSQKMWLKCIKHGTKMETISLLLSIALLEIYTVACVRIRLALAIVHMQMSTYGYFQVCMVFFDRLTVFLPIALSLATVFVIGAIRICIVSGVIR